MSRVTTVVMVFLLMASGTFAQNVRLSGKWVMTYDPDGPVVEEWVILQQDGIAKLGDKQGLYATCSYEKLSDTVVTVCNVKGKEKKMTFKTRNKFNELVNPSGAVYSKVE